MVFGMGNCTKSKLDKKQVVISVIGLDDAGKTTAVKALKGDSAIKEISPTVGFEPHELIYNGVSLVLNDLGGSARVRDIWKHYLAESYGFIFVIDSNNRNRVFECNKVFSNLLENEKVHNKPILILANKQEEINSMDESELVQYLNIEELVNRYQIPCRIETCTANSGVGTKADESMRLGFEWLLKFIIAQQDELKTRIDHDVSLQKGRESRIRTEKHERFKSKRDTEYTDEMDEYEANSLDPWKSTGLKSKNSTSSFSDSKLSAYDKQLLEDMKGNSSTRQLSTIDEERSKLKNRFMKSNKLVPLDDRGDLDFRKPRSLDNDRSWAIKDSKQTPGFSRPSRRFEN